MTENEFDNLKPGDKVFVKEYNYNMPDAWRAHYYTVAGTTGRSGILLKEDPDHINNVGWRHSYIELCPRTRILCPEYLK